jgi:hypothetical protein
MDLVEDLTDPAVPIATACAALGVSRASLYRSVRPALPRSMSPRAPSPRRLSEVERAAILDALHSAEFADQSVMEVYGTLLSRGIYLASIRTIYRVLAERGETQERRSQRLPHVHAKPSLTATAPNEVWDVGHNQAGDDVRGRVPARLRDHRPLQPLRGRMDGGVEGMQASGCSALRGDHRAPRGGAGVDGARGQRIGDEERHLGPVARDPRCPAELQPPARVGRQRVQRGPVQDPEVPTRLPGTLRRGAARPAAGSSPSSAGTTTNTTTRTSRCSRRPTSFSAESSRCASSGRPPWTLRTQRTRSASHTAPLACSCHQPPSASTRSPTALSPSRVPCLGHPFPHSFLKLAVSNALTDSVPPAAHRSSWHSSRRYRAAISDLAAYPPIARRYDIGGVIPAIPDTSPDSSPR